MMNKQKSVFEFSPEQYDAIMTTSVMNHIYSNVEKEIRKNFKTNMKILDLLCGTGLVARRIQDLNMNFVGVDLHNPFIQYAREKTNKKCKFICKDVLKFNSKEKFDVAILTSAYHHIKNKDKSSLLKKIYDMLKSDGVIIIYEELLRPYKNEKEFYKNNLEFYNYRISYLKKHNLHGKYNNVFDMLKNVCEMSGVGKHEWKITYDYIYNDLNKNGFKIEKIKKVWPQTNVFKNEKVGDFIIVAKKVK
nr:hypothetical protein [Nanoarchaeum sp.]